MFERNLTEVERRLRGQHVIYRRQDEAPLGAQEQAEVLAVPIGRADQPEQDLAFEECGLIGKRLVRCLKQAEYVADAWTAVADAVERLTP